MSINRSRCPFDPRKLTGLSERLLTSHHENNYTGAVKRLNLIERQIGDLPADAAPYQMGSLKREELIATNSMLLHEEAGAPRGTHVLVQTSTDATGGRFPLCIFDAVSTTDGAFGVRFKPVSGKVDRAAGLVWRYRDADNYYIVRANALEGNVVLYKVENGKRSDLKPVGSGMLAYGKKTRVESGRWQTLELKALGSKFALSLNGEHLFDVEDTTFTAPGTVGLWTKADSVTAFDDLAIEPAPSP